MFPRRFVLPYQDGEIVVVSEDVDFQATDSQPLDPPPQYIFGDPSFLSSRHRVIFQREGVPVASCILLAAGGATGAHDHCATVHENDCFVAVGPFVCGLSLPDLQLLWHVETNPCTCFGIHHSAQHGCLISHGELQIARLSYGGEIQWTAGGKDIFTGSLRLREDHVEVEDYNGLRYSVDIESGTTIAPLI